MFERVGRVGGVALQVLRGHWGLGAEEPLSSWQCVGGVDVPLEGCGDVDPSRVPSPEPRAAGGLREDVKRDSLGSDRLVVHVGCTTIDMLVDLNRSGDDVRSRGGTKLLGLVIDGRIRVRTNAAIVLVVGDWSDRSLLVTHDVPLVSLRIDGGSSTPPYKTQQIKAYTIFASRVNPLIALARRRCDVLFAMLRDGALYDAPASKTT